MNVKSFTEQSLIPSRSWRTTFVALSQLDYSAENVSLKRHLEDPQTIQILARAFSPFQSPTPQTKSSFETKTSAINVTPSSQARYDIKQIQEDTLWLSKQTNIDEVSALRIAILEWQTRSAQQLLRDSPDEPSAYRHRGGGASNFRASVFEPGSSLLAKSVQGKKSTKSFDERGSRYRRLLETYLSERRCILKCNEILTLIAFNDSNRSSSVPEIQKKDKMSWLREVGASVLSTWNLDDATRGKSKHPIIEAVDALRTRLEGMTQGSGWLQDEGAQEDIELAWARSQVLEMIHIMQIVFHLLEASTDLVRSSAILSWFRLMKDCEFYDNVQLVSPRIFYCHKSIDPCSSRQRFK